MIESMVDLSGRGAPQEFQRFAWVQPEHLLMLCRDFKRIYYSFVVQDLQKTILTFSVQSAPAATVHTTNRPRGALPGQALEGALQGTSVEEAVDALIAKFGKSAVLRCLQSGMSTPSPVVAPASRSQPPFAALVSHPTPDQPVLDASGAIPSHALKAAEELRSSSDHQISAAHTDVDDSFAGIINGMPAEVRRTEL